MKLLIACFTVLIIGWLSATGCRTDWGCQCATIDSAGHITPTARYDYGQISSSSAWQQCNGHNYNYDTCYMVGYK